MTSITLIPPSNLQDEDDPEVFSTEAFLPKTGKIRSQSPTLHKHLLLKCLSTHLPPIPTPARCGMSPMSFLCTMASGSFKRKENRDLYIRARIGASH